MRLALAGAVHGPSSSARTRTFAANLRAIVGLYIAPPVVQGLLSRPAEPKADAVALRALARFAERYTPIANTRGGRPCPRRDWLHFPGILGYEQRQDVDRHLTAGKAQQAVYLERIANQDTASVLADQELRGFALVGGEVLFKENCAGCHALGGAGQLNYPTLADDDWIWGGTLEEIEHTIRHGVRNGQDAEARDSIMPAFGADGILTRPQIEEVAQYVLSLSNRATNQEAAAAGEQIFVENCAACHGESGVGMPEQGAPALDDAIWLYGGELHDIAAQIGRPRLGVMPFWQGRLDDSSIKMLAVYVHGLGGGR